MLLDEIFEWFKGAIVAVSQGDTPEEPTPRVASSIFALVVLVKLASFFIVSQFLWPMVVPNVFSGAKSNPGFLNLVGLVVIYYLLFPSKCPPCECTSSVGGQTRSAGDASTVLEIVNDGGCCFHQSGPPASAPVRSAARREARATRRRCSRSSTTAPRHSLGDQLISLANKKVTA
nr:hypothetical protein [Cyanobacteriota bacterium]